MNKEIILKYKYLDSRWKREYRYSNASITYHINSTFDGFWEDSILGLSLSLPAYKFFGWVEYDDVYRNN